MKSNEDSEMYYDAAHSEAQPAPDVIEQQVTAILQATVKETNTLWVAAAEKVARVREGHEI
jgi:hypothetical protein